VPVLTAGEVAEICGGRLIGDAASFAGSVVADSREVSRAAAFAAVRGGHDYVLDALEAGAPFVIVERAESVPAGAGTAVLVGGTIAALHALAGHVRSLLDVRAVAVTGSTGKTLTKDLVAAALGVRYEVHATPRSYNTDVTAPTVVLSCPEEAGVLVAELGARRPGEIAELCSFVRPDTAVITGIGLTHLELFGSRRGIAETKSEMLTALPADGLAIVPSNDDFLDVFAAATSARLCTVGPAGTVRYRADRIDRTGRTHGVVTVDGLEIDVRLPVPNRALMRNAALAITVAVEFDVDAREAADALAGASLSGARMQIETIGNRTVVNDAYNANPTSMTAALRSVRELAAGRSVWAVLGPMAELGPESAAGHQRIGRLARALGLDGVLTVGEGAHDIAVAAGDLAHEVRSLADAVELTVTLVPEDAVVLVKASRVSGLDRFPDELRRRLDRERQGA
jgi:UDP-N-acetylmuramoyl-tripeptide--D-alanyl-D-alanine ligase